MSVQFAIYRTNSGSKAKHMPADFGFATQILMNYTSKSHPDDIGQEISDDGELQIEEATCSCDLSTTDSESALSQM
jgi:hypothetical protein